MFLCDNQWKFWTFSIPELWNRKTKIFFKKLKYRFLVKNTKIENASFPYKNAISEANVKTNKMVSAKWTYNKERSFASNYFIFFSTLFCFSLRTSYKELIWCTNDPNAHIRTFCKRWCFIWRCFFPVSILKKRFADIFRNMPFLCDTVYRLPETFNGRCS